MTHFYAIILASFSASLVECVEALTIVLAVGVSRNWKSSLSGAACGLAALVALVLVAGPLMSQAAFSLGLMQIIIGVLLLLFGLRWLRKAVLRTAGLIPLHDEALSYSKQIGLMVGKEDGQSDAFKNEAAKNRFDMLAFMASLKAVLIEGIEVVFIVLAVGAPEASLFPATLGAAAALLLIMLLGLLLHRPLTRIPENTLKFAVAVILTAFGLFWIGEGSGLRWPGGDLAIVALMALVLGTALGLAVHLKRRNASATKSNPQPTKTQI
ncbi:MAG: hypothetical protein M3N08_08665 [Pseudomonadota bacterium]|nr:hypothetical protein [Pseudomonadota bacterium]